MPIIRSTEMNQQTAYDVQRWLCCIKLAEKRQVRVHLLGVKRRLVELITSINLKLSASSWLFILLFIIQDARSNEITRVWILCEGDSRQLTGFSPSLIFPNSRMENTANWLLEPDRSACRQLLIWASQLKLLLFSIYVQNQTIFWKKGYIHCPKFMVFFEYKITDKGPSVICHRQDHLKLKTIQFGFHIMRATYWSA
jgi:hypothetical protein